MKIFLSFLIVIVPIFTAIASVAVSTFTKGDVKLIRYKDGKKTESKVEKGTKFESKDIIKTGKNAKVDIRFDNGSKITLFKESNFYIDSKNGTTVVRGKTDNEVQENSSFWNFFSSPKDKKFKFFQPNGKISTVGVRGTKFTLNTGTDNTESNVKVYEGSVLVSTPGEEDRIVEPLQKYVADNREVMPFDPNKPDPIRSIPVEEDISEKKDEEVAVLTETEEKSSSEENKKIITEEHTDGTRGQVTDREEKESQVVSKPQSVNNNNFIPQTYYYKWDSYMGGYYIYKCECVGPDQCTCEKMPK